jgi:hypothetical protein
MAKIADSQVSQLIMNAAGQCPAAFFVAGISSLLADDSFQPG